MITVDYLLAAMARLDVQNYAEAAVALGISVDAITMPLEPPIALRIADLLRLNHFTIILDMNIERWEEGDGRSLLAHWKRRRATIFEQEYQAMLAAQVGKLRMTVHRKHLARLAVRNRFGLWLHQLQHRKHGWQQ